VIEEDERVKDFDVVKIETSQALQEGKVAVVALMLST
jgi:hypothetical protein